MDRVAGGWQDVMMDGMKMRRVVRTVVIVALAGLAGCGGTPFELTQNTLDDHHARWLASGVRDYRFEYARQCECASAATRPATVEVRSGRVTDVVFSDSGEQAEPSARGSFPTIDQLFELIDEAIRRGAASLIVTYDGPLGYPTRIDIDYDAQVADDELSIDATNLQPL